MTAASERVSPATERLLELALREALSSGTGEIEPVHVVRAFCRFDEFNWEPTGRAIGRAFLTSLASSRGINERRHQ